MLLALTVSHCCERSCFRLRQDRLPCLGAKRYSASLVTGLGICGLSTAAANSASKQCHSRGYSSEEDATSAAFRCAAVESKYDASLLDRKNTKDGSRDKLPAVL